CRDRRRRRPLRGRRRRVDDPRATRDREARRALRARQPDGLRHDARLAVPQPPLRGAVLERVDGRDRRERRGALERVARGSGRLRAPFAGALGGRTGGGPLRRRADPRGGARARRAPAAGHVRREARRPATRVPQGRHRDGGERERDQRRRRRARDRQRGARPGSRRPAARGLRRLGRRGRRSRRDGHRADPGRPQAARPHGRRGRGRRPRRAERGVRLAVARGGTRPRDRRGARERQRRRDRDRPPTRDERRAARRDAAPRARSPPGSVRDRDDVRRRRPGPGGPVRAGRVLTKTQVAIVGAGPAGLTLAQLLHVAGIDSVVLENRSREYVEARIRAGVLEHDVAELYEQAGVGERMRREGLVHTGVELQSGSERHRIAFDELVGRTIVVYGQTEVVKDLIAARLESGRPLHFEVSDVSFHDLETERPRVRYVHEDAEQELECDVVAGCDGFHGVSRPSIPASVLRTFARDYPYGWLGIIAAVAPSHDELVYAHTERGFALLSMRSPELSRLYLQYAPDEDLDLWPDERIWEELQTRLGVDG